MTMMSMEFGDRSSRYLLVASLALNLFVVAAAGALYVRHQFAQPAATQAERPRTAAARIERLAATLPAADAETLRGAFRARADTTEAARDALNRASERIQGALRAEPFNPGALRAAMAETRTVRIAYDQAFHEVVAAAAAGMTAQGRAKLADWPPRPATPR
jgi:uncharacterized membrane protein